eukprot:1274771-Alexandrium_andersonii.AAC.1
MQEHIRVSTPTRAVLDNLLAERVWHRGPLTQQCFRELFAIHPDTTIICISRRCVAEVNDLAQAALLAHVPALGFCRFDEGPGRRQVQVQEGLPCILTQNMSKANGLVDGKRAR